MVDPRIYRVSWVIVLIAIIIFGFSLQTAPPAASTDLAPGVSFSAAAPQAVSLAARFGAVAPGSVRDGDFAAAMAAGLRAAGGFSVSSRTDSLRTAVGERAIATVEAERPGLGQGTIVVVADRDLLSGPPAPHDAGAVAGTAASAVLLQLARVFSGASLNRSLLLVSTSGAVGAAGNAQLAASLAGQNVDAVIVLGDLARATTRRPVVVPWSTRAALAPSALAGTLSRYLGVQAGLSATLPSFSAQLSHLAFPFTAGGQGPFAAAGLPAVTVSLSGDRLPQPGERVDPARIAGLGLALDQSISALEAGPTLAPPGRDLSLASKLVPLWAVRLLVLALIAPVAATLIDAIARARRRGHSILSWSVWVLSGTLPWILGLLVLRAAGVLALVPTLPAPVDGSVAVSLGAAGTGVVALGITAVALRLLRPVGVQIASGIGWRRTPTSPAIEGASVALSLVLCALTLLVWSVNPFAAALFVPALHLWLWVGSPGVAGRWGRSVLLILAGLLAPLLLAIHVMLSLGLSPWGFAASLVRALSGSAVTLGLALSWCVALGVLSGIVVLLARAVRASAVTVEAPVTVRGPATYAGPGSLGGTQSALRR
ncbi:MAG TPA: hypothetical protein VFN48_11905 [Solirubrobacteraceae bacterium]|nr:hypothetical protein [Solirubrobacteraceae bacterium]